MSDKSFFKVMRKLFVFNPEHEYALAHGGRFYMAPRSIQKLADDLKLLPLIWADKEDYILLPDNKIILANKGEKKYVDLSETRIEKIEPWGWNEALLQRLCRLGVDVSLLPSSEYIMEMRRLSHRRISITCNEFLKSGFQVQEFTDVEKAMAFSTTHQDCYFKLPWSGGGRGVLATKELNMSQIREWVTGAVKKQGSVLAEAYIDRKIDFASLWNINDNETCFEGFSLSLSDGRGKYNGNLSAPQNLLIDKIKSLVPSLSLDLIERQKDFISKFIAPYYNGKLGIDMAADKKGNIYPCVEINLRRTMGHVAMDYANLSSYEKLQIDISKTPLVNV